jgi:hypothetical protein
MSRSRIVPKNRNRKIAQAMRIQGLWAKSCSYRAAFLAVDEKTYARRRSTASLEPENTVNWEHRAHSLKFGATSIRRQISYFSAAAAKGFFNIPTTATISPALKLRNCWPERWTSIGSERRMVSTRRAVRFARLRHSFGDA